jgi:hypothetical protein
MYLITLISKKGETMAVRRIIPDMAYGIGDALIPLAPLPIIARRDPKASDQAQLGTTWVNEATGAVWILARIVSNASDWVTSPVIGGAGVFTSLDITSGSLTIDSGAGGIDVNSGAFSVDNSGNVVTNNITVNGTATIAGDFDLTSAALIDLTSTLNAAPSIALTANGGANEQILLHSVQGTSATSIDIVSDLGGVHVEGNANSSSAIVLDAANAAGGITLSAGTNGIGLSAVNGAIALSSGTGGINIGVDAAAHAIVLGNSTGATSIALNVGTGALNLGTNAIAHVVTIGNVTGATAVNINAGSAGIALLSTNSTMSLSSGTGVMNISADGAATTVNIATAAAVKTLTAGSVTGASVSTVRAGSGGLNLTAANGVVTMTSGTGAMNISADAAATTVSVGTGAAVKTVVVGSTTGASVTTLQGGTAGVVVSAPFLALPGPIFIYTGAGVPAGALSLHVGDLYINTTAATAVTRMYIADTIGTWTNITCAA